MLYHRLEALAESQQILDLCAQPVPLFPETHAQVPSDPVIQFGHWLVILWVASTTLAALRQLPQPVKGVECMDD